MLRLETRTTQRIVDFTVLSLALWAAVAIRFDGDVPYQYLKRSLFMWPYLIGFEYACLAFFRVPRFAWRYVGLREVTRILWALGIAAGVMLVFRLVIAAFFNVGGPAQFLFLPLGIIAINFMLSFLGVAGVRVLRRLRFDQAKRRLERPLVRRAVPAILIGAGRAGLATAKELLHHPQLGYRPVGFIDDDPAKHGTEVHGLRVLGATAELADVAERLEVEQAIITIANASGPDIRRITSACELANLPLKIVPGLQELLDGNVNLTQIREVTIEDLLRREVVVLEEDVVSAMVTGRRVLITGAGGSIGSEICRQVARHDPERLILVERSEPNLFQIHRELCETTPDIDVIPCLADVCDEPRLSNIFERHRPAVVVHAAAHKHVPMMEWNPGEAIKNNVFGTETVTRVSSEHGVVQFVLVSTDKAVNPTSVMGATKRVAEILTQCLAQTSKTRFVAVRFGNVLGSAGSVVPIFRKQVRAGGPVTVTHPEMRRYFMTIPEATSLVLQAAAIGHDGEVLTLDMGDPVRIVDLAEDLIRLSGFEPNRDIPIVFTGVRPGEKLFEELGFDPATMERTRHPKIFVLNAPPRPADAASEILAQLGPHIETTDVSAVRSVLESIIPEMQKPHDPPDETMDSELQHLHTETDVPTEDSSSV